MPGLENEIITATKSGEFLKKVHDIYIRDRGDGDHAGEILAKLHNAGKIDVVKEFNSLTRNSDNTDFFMARHIFEKALPSIDGPVLDILNCVKHLVSEAGEDMTANSTYTPLFEFCDNNPSRPEAVLKLALAGNDWVDFTTLALISGAKLDLHKYVKKACSLASDENKQYRPRAVFSLGRFDYQGDRDQIDAAFSCLEEIVNSGCSDQVAGAVIQSAFNLLVLDLSLNQRFLSLLNKLITLEGPDFLFMLSQIFAFDTKNIPSCVMSILLDTFVSVDASNKNTIDRIDIGVGHLICAGDVEEAVCLVENILIKNHPVINIDMFNRFTGEFNRGSETNLNYLITRWFLSRKSALCKATLDILQNGRSNEVEIKADLSQLENTPDGSRVFLARKSVGWLIFKPVTSASFILSLFEGAEESECLELSVLLFNPLLVNYPGSVGDYLRKVIEGSNEKAEKFINGCLEELDKYQQGLKSVGDIPEIQPSIAHRETYYRLFNRQMSETYEEAQKGSIMSMIATKSVLLYGRSSVHYIHGPSDEPPRRSETPLTSHGHSIEMPRLEYIDPHGLGYQLRVFRTEGCEK